MSIDVFFVAVAGVLAGGAVNLIADALPRGEAIGRPKYSNGERRPPLAWLGIGAFIFGLRYPKDAPCETRPMGWRYPLAEIACSLLMLLFFSKLKADVSISLAHCLIRLSYAPLFVLITVIDMEHRRIPFPLASTLASLALISSTINHESTPSVQSSLLGGLLGLLVFYAVFLGGIAFSRLISRMRRGQEMARAFGFGDVLLMAAVGMAVGFPDVLLAMTLTILLGAVGGFASIFCRYMRMGKYRAFTTMPYAPFISAAAIIALLR